MTTRENFKKAWIANGLQFTEEKDSMTMTAHGGKMRTTYYFNEKGDLTGYKTENL